MRKSILVFLLLVTAGLGGTDSHRGGWAIVTIDDLPDYVVAGQPIQLSFVVRQHGMRPVPRLEPIVGAKLGTVDISLHAKQTDLADSGRYVATLILPRAGEWAVTIQSGFGAPLTTSVPLRAVEAGASPRALSDVERGRRLFIAKGCFGCHVNTEVTNAPSFGGGPVLTGRRYPAVNLARFLANPDSNQLTQIPLGWLRMPNLGLKDREIAALVAMINSGGRELSAR